MDLLPEETFAVFEYYVRVSTTTYVAMYVHGRYGFKTVC